MPALGLLHQRELLVGVPALALPLRHLRAVTGRAGVIQTKATCKVYKTPEAIAQRLWLPFLVLISAAIAPKLDSVAVRCRTGGVVPNQSARIAVENRVITARGGRPELPLLVGLLVAAGPLLQVSAVARAPPAGVHTEPAGLVDHLIPGVGIDRTPAAASTTPVRDGEVREVNVTRLRGLAIASGLEECFDAIGIARQGDKLR